MSDKFYACYESNIIKNVIVADSEEIAKSITGMNVIETTGSPWVDWFLQDSVWYPPKPYESWQWDGQSWQPPHPYPQNNIAIEYFWDEEDVKWVAVIPEQPYPSWVFSEDIWLWIPPISPDELPEDIENYYWDEDSKKFVLK